MLARLVLGRGGLVGAEQLVEALWGDDPPATATASLQTYISHLQTIRAFLGGFIAYDAAFRAKQKKDEKQMLDQFDMCEFLFSETRDQVLKTVKQLAASAFVEDPTEKYLLFRYNVRFVLPIEQFGKFIKNVVNFHHGQPWPGQPRRNPLKNLLLV